MQRSLLPREQPQSPGLDIGAVYASSARMDVGGDVYDFLELADGRLAVVLGDVTGHGIDAAADMAMAKFVFRSLAREHSEPSEFLAAANEIVLEEIGEGKFITMLYVTADGREGELACASAGHPPPRVVRASGAPTPLGVRGLALGIAGDQEYDVERVLLEPGRRRGALHRRLARGAARRRALRRGASRRVAREARVAAGARSWPRRSSRTAGPSAATSPTTVPSSSSSGRDRARSA